MFQLPPEGHPSSNHPHRAMFCMERRSHRPIQSDETPVRGEAKPGSVEGTAVNNILLDTSRTLVQKDLVPKEKLLEATLSPLVLLG